MILTLIGGGGFRVPLVHAALLADDRPGRVDELRLVDTDSARLSVIMNVLAGQAAVSAGVPVRVSAHTDLAEALRGTDVVFSAMRVGGLAGRVSDERVALDNGVIGQETVGAGGISYALRTLPVALRLARTVRDVAPEAWVINFTNPAGMITEAMINVLGDRVIGICDSPIGLARRALRALGEPLEGAKVGYAGLNHLGWVTSLERDGADLLPELLGRPDALTGFEEGRLFGADWLHTLGSLPNEYLHYYYFTREQLAVDEACQPRGSFLAEQQGGFYATAARPGANPLACWEDARMERERTYLAANRSTAGSFERDPQDLVSGGYDQVALAIVHAIGRNVPAELILNVRNRGTLAGLDDDAVVEVPCHVDAGGVTPLPNTGIPAHGRGLVTTIKQVERYTITAATTGSRRAALLALATHPLIDSVRVAERVLDGYAAVFPEVAALR